MTTTLELTLISPRSGRSEKVTINLNLGVLQALVSHKNWLRSLKQEIRENKKIEASNELNEQLKRLKVREESKQLRDQIRSGETPEEFVLPKTGSLIAPPTQSQVDSEENEKKRVTFRDSAAEQVQEQQPEPKDVPEKRQKEEKKEKKAETETAIKKQSKMAKKKMPAWAMTKQQEEVVQEVEDDELLDFMDNLDFDSYKDDLEFRNMVSTLQARVSELKKEEGWKDKWEGRLKEKSEQRKQEYLAEKAEKQLDDDMVTNYGDNSNIFDADNKSISSSRTQESIQSIKEKMKLEKEGVKDWDGQVSYF